MQVDPLDLKEPTGQCSKQTPVRSANQIALPALTPKGILKKTGSSQKKHLKELLSLLTPIKKEVWRSSPGLFAENSESESESDGWINSPPENDRRPPSQWVSDTPTHNTHSDLSGFESLSESDEENPETWEKWLEEGGGPPLTLTPPPLMKTSISSCNPLSNCKMWYSK
nr:MAG: ORF3 [Torque teno polar bear virus 25]